MDVAFPYLVGGSYSFVWQSTGAATSALCGSASSRPDFTVLLSGFPWNLMSNIHTLIEQPIPASIHRPCAVVQQQHDPVSHAVQFCPVCICQARLPGHSMGALWLQVQIARVEQRALALTRAFKAAGVAWGRKLGGWGQLVPQGCVPYYPHNVMQTQRAFAGAGPRCLCC